MCLFPIQRVNYTSLVLLLSNHLLSLFRTVFHVGHPRERFLCSLIKEYIRKNQPIVKEKNNTQKLVLGLISDNKCYHPLLNLSRFVNVLLKDVTFKTLPSIVEVMMTQRYFTLMPRFNFLNIFFSQIIEIWWARVKIFFFLSQGIAASVL